MKYIKCGNERSFEQEKETKKIVEDIGMVAVLNLLF